MKRSHVKIKKQLVTTKRQQETARRIRKARGKYKYLELMRGLVDARKEERRPDSKTQPAISARSLKMLDKSADSLKKGLASAPIAPPNWKIQ